ncbi:MAG TPA: hypothetical protein VNK52_12345 [Hyphomicrobiaceae bacterium]|nr:hypothetical protein [Hyphomicrobiaceae bacterium]
MSLLRQIAFGLRTQGLAYIRRWPRNELWNPRQRLTPHLRAAIIAAREGVCGRDEGEPAWSEGCLQLVHDLGAAPVTFDFAGYLAAAEVERRRRGLAGINVVFVAGPFNGVREELQDYERARDVEARHWRIRHILLPMLAFLPSVRGYAYCASREQARALAATDPGKLYPSDYRVFLPRHPSKRALFEHARTGGEVWPLLRATPRGIRLAAQYLQRVAHGRRAIVITLRLNDFAPERNSRTAEWRRFADGLDEKRYAVVFVPDTETLARDGPPAVGRHLVCEAACWSLEFRMGLYERAWLNMGTMNGPLELCWYNEKVRYVAFLELAADNVEMRRLIEESGLTVNANLAFARPWQRLVWAGDHFEVIRGEFEDMERALAAVTANARPVLGATGIGAASSR